MKHLNSGKKVDVVHEDVIAFETEDTERHIALEMAMQWTNAYSESVHTYANTINTHEGGTHEEGFRAAMTSLDQPLRAGEEHHQGKGRQPHRR